MKTLTVYDPAMCCSTGICGADIDWLKSEGIEVRRINLSQEPALFAENEQVKTILEKSGVEGLPVILANDEIHSSGQYPDRVTLAQMVGIKAVQSADHIVPTGCCGEASEEEKSSCCS